MIRQLLKRLTTPRIQDALRIFGRKGTTISGRKIEMEDGSPVTVDHIMSVYTISRSEAVRFVQRHS